MKSSLILALLVLSLVSCHKESGNALNDDATKPNNRYYKWSPTFGNASRPMWYIYSDKVIKIGYQRSNPNDPSWMYWKPQNWIQQAADEWMAALPKKGKVSVTDCADDNAKSSDPNIQKEKNCFIANYQIVVIFDPGQGRSAASQDGTSIMSFYMVAGKNGYTGETEFAHYETMLHEMGHALVELGDTYLEGEFVDGAIQCKWRTVWDLKPVTLSDGEGGGTFLSKVFKRRERSPRSLMCTAERMTQDDKDGAYCVFCRVMMLDPDYYHRPVETRKAAYPKCYDDDFSRRCMDDSGGMDIFIQAQKMPPPDPSLVPISGPLPTMTPEIWATLQRGYNTVPDEPTPSLPGGRYPTPPTVALSTNADNAIYYTTDGSVPSFRSTRYTAPLTLTLNTSLRAVAVDSGGKTSNEFYGLYLVAAVAPTFSPAGGAVSAGTKVTLSTPSPGATIYYSFNGTPSAASEIYSAPITLSEGKTITAITVTNDNVYSSVSGATYTISAGTTAVTPPTFSPAPGAVNSGTSVTLSSATAGATLYYTLDGSTPTTASAVYSTPIAITTARTIKAFAAKSGSTSSAVVTANYTIVAATTVAAPKFSPAPGAVTSGTSATLSSATAGATLYYTLDGSTPTTASAVYSTPIAITTARTIKAFAAKSGSTSSAVVTANYQINATAVGSPPPNPTALSVTSTGTNQVSLKWTSGGETTTGFVVAYQIGNTAPANCSSGTVLPLTVANTATVTGLSLDEVYSFRVCATNSAGALSSGVMVTAITSCFIGETKIAKPDGSSIAIEDLRTGDEVQSFDENGNLTVSVVEAILVHDVDGYLQVAAGGVQVGTTANHPFFAGVNSKTDWKIANFKPVGNFVPGESIYRLEQPRLTAHAIEKITPVEQKVKVYNLHLKQGPATFFANGFAVHNY